MTNTNPIGVFDSGVGGTSIWKEIINQMPQEDTIYLADSKNSPYGEKSNREIVNFSIKNVEFLIKKKSKIIVVACNTATTNTIDILRKKFDIPFIGIEPAIKPAVLFSKKAIGILATRRTLMSEFYKKSKKMNFDGLIIERDATDLVPFIERNLMDSLEMKHLLEKLLKPMIEHQMDCLVLGCSHYPYLIPQIKKIIGNEVNIIDSSYAVAKQVRKVLIRNKILNETDSLSTHELITNGDENILSSFVEEIKDVEVKHLDF